MVVRDVVVLIGQSNMEGLADRANLTASLRGAQSGSVIHNYENAAWETLNVDGLGTNLPNNTTAHVSPYCGPEMTIAAAENAAAAGSIYLFKYALGSSALGPVPSGKRTWSIHAADAWTEFQTRFAQAIVDLGADTLNVTKIYWLQGEYDAGVDGLAQAYEGHFGAFIRAARAYLSAFSTLSTIPFVSGLPSTQQFSAGLLGTVRSAQRKAGTLETEFKLFDTIGAGLLADYLHFNAAGVEAIGTGMYAASLLATSGAMVFEDYTLSGMRDRLRNDYGLENTTDNNEVIRDKINDAITWVVRRRPNWPWMEMKGYLNTDPSVAGSAIVTQYNTTMLSIKGGLLKRQFIKFPFDGTNSRQMILGVSGSSAEIAEQPMGENTDFGVGVYVTVTPGTTTTITILGDLTPTNAGTGLFGALLTNIPRLTGAGPADLGGTYDATRIDATSFTIPVDTTGSTYDGTGAIYQLAINIDAVHGAFEMPEDMVRMEVVHIKDDLGDTQVSYLPPRDFEKLKNQRDLSTTNQHYYTVIADPLGEDDSKYLLLYPYLEARQIVRYRYWRDAPKLVDDGDIPIIPRSDRATIYYAAGWFVAQWQNEEAKLESFQKLALQAVEAMVNQHEFTTDEDHAGIAPYASGRFLRGPDGTFPDFDDSSGYY